MGKKGYDPKEAFKSLTRAQQAQHVRLVANFRAHGAMNRCLACGRPTAGFVPRQQGSGKSYTLRETGICDC